MAGVVTGHEAVAVRRCRDCGGEAVRVTRFAGKDRTRYACAPYCRINNVIRAAASPIDEFGFEWAGPTPYIPADFEDVKRGPRVA